MKKSHFKKVIKYYKDSLDKCLTEKEREFAREQIKLFKEACKATDTKAKKPIRLDSQELFWERVENLKEEMRGWHGL